MTPLTKHIKAQKEICLSRLKQAYENSLNGSVDDRLLRRRMYNAIRLFSLECSLLTFEEIELMEDEVKNN